MLFVVGADDAVGAQQRLAVDTQTNHGEVAVRKAQSHVAGGGEAEQAVGPVVNRQHGFVIESAHSGTLAEGKTINFS